MNISSLISNSYFNKSSHLIPIHENSYEQSMFSTTTEQYNLTSVPIIYYPEYPINYYHLPDDYIPYQPLLSHSYPHEEKVSMIKIHVNPFFRRQPLNQTSESSSEIDQQHNSSVSSPRSRSRSPSSDRQVIMSPKKKHPRRQIQKAQREKFIQEKRLIIKRQSSDKHHRSSPDRWEHKDEQLKRLFDEYSNENPYQQWKPLLLKECFELYQYAFDKYHETSVDN